MTFFSLSLDEAGVDYFSELPCPHCGAFLIVHLPDLDTPDRLLGTCEGCKGWFLIDAERGVMASLPIDDLLNGG